MRDTGATLFAAGGDPAMPNAYDGLRRRRGRCIGRSTVRGKAHQQLATATAPAIATSVPVRAESRAERTDGRDSGDRPVLALVRAPRGLRPRRLRSARRHLAGRDARHEDGAGIWHETYLVRAGDYEAIHRNMPAFGLGAAGRLTPISASSTARLRVRARDGSQQTPPGATLA